jgi:hypothetical protein
VATIIVSGRISPASVSSATSMSEYPDPLPYLMGQASAELWMTGPTRLYRRFVAWTLDKDAACRVCGKAGHDVLPGLPHRFFPCDGYPIEPIHRPAKR